jgi:hypothetical protein
LVWRRFSDDDASQGVFILATMEGCDSVIGGRLLPIVGLMKLFGEFLKEELDCEPGDIPLDVDVQGVESGHLGVRIEFAVHALQHLAINIGLRIILAVVFASSGPLEFGTWLQDSAGSFYARMCLAHDGWGAAIGGPSKFLQFV